MHLANGGFHVFHARAGLARRVLQFLQRLNTDAGTFCHIGQGASRADEFLKAHDERRGQCRSRANRDNARRGNRLAPIVQTVLRLLQALLEVAVVGEQTHVRATGLNCSGCCCHNQTSGNSSVSAAIVTLWRFRLLSSRQ